MMKERKERRASSCADVGVGGGFGIGLWCCSDYPPAYKVAQEANRHKQRCHLLLCISNTIQIWKAVLTLAAPPRKFWTREGPSTFGGNLLGPDRRGERELDSGFWILE